MNLKYFFSINIYSVSAPHSRRQAPGQNIGYEFLNFSRNVPTFLLTKAVFHILSPHALPPVCLCVSQRVCVGALHYAKG